jgi:predicted RNA-binding Zn-ribbon protein involved in translation (DUF1610 family)
LGIKVYARISKKNDAYEVYLNNKKVLELPFRKADCTKCDCGGKQRKKEEYEKIACKCHACSRKVELILNRREDATSYYCPYCGKHIVLCEKCWVDDKLIKLCPANGVCPDARKRLFERFCNIGISKELSQKLSELNVNETVSVSFSSLKQAQVNAIAEAGYVVKHKTIRVYEIFGNRYEDHYIISRVKMPAEKVN